MWMVIRGFLFEELLEDSSPVEKVNKFSCLG